MRWVLCSLLLLMLVGCGAGSVHELAQALNDRGVSSCIWVTAGYVPFGSLRLVTATGNATLTECVRQ